jgi:hypothetical protein
MPPVAQSNTFEGVNKTTCILNVPRGSVTTYRLHPVWEDFFTIREKDFWETNIPVHEVVAGISAHATSNGIQISGCHPTDKVSVYNLAGQPVYSGAVGNGFLPCSLQKGNVYVIRTPQKSLKVVF